MGELLVARSIHFTARGHNPGLVESMIEDDEAVVKANVTIRQFEIVDGFARKPWFDEIFKVVAPEAKTSSQWKGQVDLLQQFVARHQRIQHVPWIAKLLVHAVCRSEFTPRTLRTER